MTRLFMVFMLTVLLSMRIMNAATHYVVPPGTVGVIPVNPYTNWTTAGTNIIEVVNAAMTNTAPMHIWVSNGTYYLTNHVYVNNAVTIQSVNGRDMTIVDGNCPNTTNRCFYLDHAGAVLDGFTITNGMENQLGGGILVTNGIVTNCLIVDNQLTNSGGSYGAGVLIYYGTLTDSIVMRNRGARYGSGAIVMLSEGSIRNCVFSQNTNNPSFGASVEVWGHSTISNSVISNNYGVGL
ncbi:MAG: hypothetical protein PHP98_12160, partial [Kiritimatiellae bacterium]|nr:hypothetical protein [Kiritimatiellia bacterium]